MVNIISGIITRLLLIRILRVQLKICFYDMHHCPDMFNLLITWIHKLKVQDCRRTNRQRSSCLVSLK